MKFAFKNLVAGAALVAVGTANAAYGDFPQLVVAGSGKVILSNDSLSALSAAGASIRTATAIPNVSGLPGVGALNSATLSLSTGVLGFNFASVTTTLDAVSSLQAPHSFVDLRRVTVEDDDSISIRSVYLTNVELSLSDSTIYANLYSYTSLNNSATRQLVNFGRQAIFTADVPGIVGGTQGNIVIDSVTDLGVPTFHASGSLAGALRINTNAANIMLTSLGVEAGGVVANLWHGTNWGTSSFTATSVPEPSTYAMFGIGLLAMGALTRRRPQAA